MRFVLAGLVLGSTISLVTCLTSGLSLSLRRTREEEQDHGIQGRHEGDEPTQEQGSAPGRQSASTGWGAFGFPERTVPTIRWRHLRQACQHQPRRGSRQWLPLSRAA